MTTSAGDGPDVLRRLPSFQTYALGQAYDEMFDPSEIPRTQYAELLARLQELDVQTLEQRQAAADLAFLHQGITFTVYGESQGTERIFPYDLIPRIITAAEWDVIERGLTQRLTALNLFLSDLYSKARVLADGIVPAALVYSCKHFRREMQGVTVPRDIHVSVERSRPVRPPEYPLHADDRGAETCGCHLPAHRGRLSWIRRTTRRRASATCASRLVETTPMCRRRGECSRVTRPAPFWSPSTSRGRAVGGIRATGRWRHPRQRSGLSRRRDRRWITIARCSNSSSSARRAQPRRRVRTISGSTRSAGRCRHRHRRRRRKSTCRQATTKCAAQSSRRGENR